MHKARPNILVVMADQLSPAFLPIHGFDFVKAPNITRLAERGVVFDSAYCNSPLCSPSRAVFMTGALPSRTGVYDNAAEFHADIPTWAHHLRLAGYKTMLSGKMHFCGPDQLHGIEQRLTTDIYPADFGWTPDWDRPDVRPSWYHNMSSVTDAGPCVRTNQIDFDEETIHAAERALYDHVRSPDKRPFCLVASLTHPHDPFAITRDYWDLYGHEAIPMPRRPQPPEPVDPHTKRLRHVSLMDETPVSDEQVRAARHAYFAAISYVDANLGRLMRTLDATGLADDTIVILTSDHGEMLGERGAWYKMSWLEPSARVPLVIAGPGHFAPKRVSSSVSLVDILPTLVELAGGEPSLPEIDGRSLVAHCEGLGGHDEAIGEYLAEGAVAPMVMIRRGPWKFIHSPSDPDQLFDLASDPDETRNLAEDEAAAETLAAFRADVARRWDLAKLDQTVRASQRRRRLVDRALSTGTVTAWDFQPVVDASKQYMRNTIDLDDLEAMARFPRVRP
ncbi:MAG: choline-sulfatase [Microvirga sp.]